MSDLPNAISKNEARDKIAHLWELWNVQHPVVGGASPLTFYRWLEHEHSHVLSFDFDGDRFQQVVEWINAARSS